MCPTSNEQRRHYFAGVLAERNYYLFILIAKVATESKTRISKFKTTLVKLEFQFCFSIQFLVNHSSQQLGCVGAQRINPTTLKCLFTACKILSTPSFLQVWESCCLLLTRHFGSSTRVTSDLWSLATATLFWVCFGCKKLVKILHLAPTPALSFLSFLAMVLLLPVSDRPLCMCGVVH